MNRDKVRGSILRAYNNSSTFSMIVWRSLYCHIIHRYKTLEKHGAIIKERRRWRRMRHLPRRTHKSSGIALQSQILLRVLEWLAVETRRSVWGQGSKYSMSPVPRKDPPFQRDDNSTKVLAKPPETSGGEGRYFISALHECQICSRKIGR